MSKKLVIFLWVALALLMAVSILGAILTAYPAQVHASTWRTSQAKGEYRCLGSNAIAGAGQFVWIASFRLDGKASGSIEYGIVPESLEHREESTKGSYSVNSAGVFDFQATNGTLYMVGPMVQGGKGFLVSVELWTGEAFYLFSANCWK